MDLKVLMGIKGDIEDFEVLKWKEGFIGIKRIF